MNNKDICNYTYNPNKKIEGFRKTITERQLEDYFNFYGITEELEKIKIVSNLRYRGYTVFFDSGDKAYVNNHIGETKTTIGYVDLEQPHIKKMLEDNVIIILE